MKKTFAVAILAAFATLAACTPAKAGQYQSDNAKFEMCAHQAKMAVFVAKMKREGKPSPFDLDELRYDGFLYEMGVGLVMIGEMHANDDPRSTARAAFAWCMDNIDDFIRRYPR